ncbi:MAG: hypothetical protein PUF12_01600 [Thermoflexaceae bacterium]|nr:hypothetical protein [Thermoflexaceae bacterium]
MRKSPGELHLQLTGLFLMCVMKIGVCGVSDGCPGWQRQRMVSICAKAVCGLRIVVF